MSFLYDSSVQPEDRLEETIERLRAITVESSDLPTVWIVLAESFEKLGDLTQAMGAWRMAHRLVPNSPRIASAIRRLESGASEASAASSTHESQPDVEPTETPSESRQHASLDLDLLISDLQSGRSLPDSEHHQPEPEPAAQTDDEEIATETLAKIFESQRHFSDAARIYDLLADREGDAAKAEVYHARSEDLRKRIVKPS